MRRESEDAAYAEKIARSISPACTRGDADGMKSSANLSKAMHDEARRPRFLSRTYCVEKALALSSVGNTSTALPSTISIRSCRVVMMGL